MEHLPGCFKELIVVNKEAASNRRNNGVVTSVDFPLAVALRKRQRSLRRDCHKWIKQRQERYR